MNCVPADDVKRLRQLKLSDGDLQKLPAVLGTGTSWLAVSRATKIPYSTVKKHARLMGYEPRRANTTEKCNG
jgi:hypothetical protein